MKAYRFQDKNREIEALLDPEQQFSYSWDLSLEETDAARHGISACESLADLAAYVACSGLQAIDPGLIVLASRYQRAEAKAKEGKNIKFARNILIDRDGEASGERDGYVSGIGWMGERLDGPRVGIAAS